MVEKPEITITAIRDAINVPEVTELRDEAVQSGIDRAWPIVKSRIRGGEDAELIEMAYITVAAYFAALTEATRAHQRQPGRYDQSTGKWTPKSGAEGRDWNQVLDHLRDLMNMYLDALTPEPEPAQSRLLRRSKTMHWG